MSVNMRIAAVTVLVGIVGVDSGISCTSNEECGSAKDACHKAAYCIATEVRTEGTILYVLQSTVCDQEVQRICCSWG